MLTSNKPLVLNKKEEKEFHAAVSLHIYNSIGGLGRVVHRQGCTQTLPLPRGNRQVVSKRHLAHVMHIKAV